MSARGLALAALSVLLAEPARASDAAELDAALAAHAAEARALQRSPYRPEVVVDSAALLRVVERAYGPDAAVLVHRFEAQALRSWLVRPGTGVVAGTCPRSSSEVAGILGRLHGGLAVTLAGSGGQIAFRGVEPLAGRPPRAPDPERFATAAATLAGCLFPGEIEAALQGVRRLVVVPTQFLGIVPYALLSPGGRGPLVETTAVSIAPSAGALGPLADVNERGAPEDPLVVGDPAAGSGGDLPAARREAFDVAAAWNATPLVGPDARRQLVVRRAETADLLYFATHGVVIPARQVGRGTGDRIVLADGGWTAWDITFTRLRARLAVLSACDSALGLPSAGGVAGVARAFHQAGVPRVVASLWNVSDQATAELMVDFARRLPAAEPAEALRLAMLAQRQRTSDPALWGAFTVFGAPRAGFAAVGAGEPASVAEACRVGCLVVFTPRDGVPRPLCEGKPACAEVYAGPGPGGEGTLWLARLEDSKSRRAAWRAAEETGRSGLTLALLESLSPGAASVYRRDVP